MRNTHLHLALAWTLILAQLTLLGFAYGRVVICHDATGPSHIELVNDNSCSASNSEACAQPANTSAPSASSSCAQTDCTDQVFTISATVQSLRKPAADLDAYSIDHHPTVSLLIAYVALITTDGATSAVTLMPDTVPAFTALQRSIRSTVLVL